MHLTSTDESNFGITLTVKTLMGRSLHIKIEPQEKISTLKQRLAAISGKSLSFSIFLSFINKLEKNGK
jgi:hypothetical protein